MDSANQQNFKWIWLIFGLIGVIVGLGGYTLYVSRSWVYVSDKAEVCVTCHVMGPYYQSWAKSSHAIWTNCNDCHVPQDNVLKKWAFKATDGLYHAAVFTFGSEPQTIRAREGSQKVIWENCLRCHTPLVSEYTKMGVDYNSVKNGDKKACWDCHRDTPHTMISSVSSIVYGDLPLPDSPVPQWLGSMLGSSK
jgi:cytochrome c nitrite reductase small subunit